MSRIGKLPIKIEDGVKVEFKDRVVTVTGKLGTLSQAIENKAIDIKIEDGFVHVVCADVSDKKAHAAYGLYRALIHNMVVGVTKGYEKGLVLAGVGYKATLTGNDLVLNVGFSHAVNFKAPAGIKFECPKPEEIKVKGISKELVGQTAANIRAIRKTEPYHGYGIRYADEVILRKEGKTNGK